MGYIKVHQMLQEGILLLLIVVDGLVLTTELTAFRAARMKSPSFSYFSSFNTQDNKPHGNSLNPQL